MKAIREGRVNLKDSYGRVEGGEVFLHNLHVSPYSHRGYAAHEPLRRRKLLLNKRAILLRSAPAHGLYHCVGSGHAT